MDKFFNSPWFVRFISFFIALMLFMMVNMDNITTTQPGVLPNVSTASYTLEDVQLNAYYDEERYAITEMTESVQVNLRGPQSVITLFQVARPTYEVFVDVQERGAGVHHISVQHRGFPRDLSVSIVPQFVRIVLQEKRTISLPVNVDIVNGNEIVEGYTVGTPIVTPINVEITAAEDIIEQVAIARAYIDVAGANRTIEKGVPVKVYDDAGNELHLDIEPAVVDVRVPVTSPFKNVPLKINRVGELPEGTSIESITANPKEVTIYGPTNTLNNINVLEVDLNLNQITETQTVQLRVPKPRGIEMVTPEIVDVTVDVTVEEEILIEGIPITINGLADGMEAIFEDPTFKAVDIRVRGARPLLEKLKPEEIQAYIELNQFSIGGPHELGVQIVGPYNLSFKAAFDKVAVLIKETTIDGELE